MLPSFEIEALMAVMADDIPGARAALSKLMPGEVATLHTHLTVLKTMIEGEMERRSSPFRG